MDMSGSNNGPDIQYWQDFLNERAAELGLEANVKVVKPRDGIAVITWVYELSDSSLVELGWSVEQAEMGLRDLASQPQV